MSNRPDPRLPLSAFQFGNTVRAIDGEKRIAELERELAAEKARADAAEAESREYSREIGEVREAHSKETRRLIEALGWSPESIMVVHEKDITDAVVRMRTERDEARAALGRAVEELARFSVLAFCLKSRENITEQSSISLGHWETFGGLPDFVADIKYTFADFLRIEEFVKDPTAQAAGEQWRRAMAVVGAAIKEVDTYCTPDSALYQAVKAYEEVTRG